MARLVLVLALVCAGLGLVQADVYLHNPRGGNNRLDEANRDRNNGNRLFDSQNNNRGGSNVGSVYYVEGSEVPIEWTSQHSCGNPNNNCEVIIQYTCDDLIRDGTTTSTIPDTPNKCTDYDCDTDVEYGRHESYQWYQDCKARARNKGLFTANQNLKGNSAKYTRQNPNGARRGYECPEERDYYPYWHPTMWKDIAVITNNPQRCPAYQAESQNVKARFYCNVTEAMKKHKIETDYAAKNRGRKPKRHQMQRAMEGIVPITEAECVQFEDPETQVKANWVEVPAWGVEAPRCVQSLWARDNHHGNMAGGFMTNFNWTVPQDFHERCVLRMRYNISTAEFNRNLAEYSDPTVWQDGWASATSVQAGVNASMDTTGKRQPNKYPARLDVWSKFGLTEADVAKDLDGEEAGRGYVFKNNPKVDIFGDGQKFQLAINTNQFGRTFQDRTHTFAIRPRPSGVSSGARIFNVQVRGKRGNIVQTYPGLEYDFTPNRLHVRRGDFIHFQWTGSNTNPNNNAGQGRQGTDRSNVVVLKAENYIDGPGDNGEGRVHETTGHWGNSYPGRVDEHPFLGWDKQTLQNLAILDTPGGQFRGELSELDDAGTYFDLGPKEVTQDGIFHYLSTRNNNFSNRSQKGKIVVSDEDISADVIGWAGGEIAVDSAKLRVKQGAMMSAAAISLGSMQISDGTQVTVEPQTEWPVDAQVGKPVIEIGYSGGALNIAKMVRVDAEGQRQTVNSDCASSPCAAEITQGGTYVVESEMDPGKVAGVVIGVVVGVAVLAFIGFKIYKRQSGGGTASSNSMPLGNVKV